MIRRSEDGDTSGMYLVKENEEDQKVALTWKPEGKRKRGRPREAWRRTAEKERNEMGWPSWRAAEEGSRGSHQGQAKVERSVPRLMLLEE